MDMCQQRLKLQLININLMRILHFSDFHLDGKHIDESKFVLDYVMEALAEINEEQKIDLVLLFW